MIFDKLKKLIAEQFGVDEKEITLETSLEDDLGADSVDLVELCMGLEEVFGIEELNVEELSEDSATELRTVGDVVKLLQERLGDL